MTELTALGDINNKFAVEVVAAIWHHMTIRELVVYGATSHAMYDQVQDAIRDTVHGIVGDFTGDPVRMLKEMLDQKAVIAGSIPLHVMLSVNIWKESKTAYGWYPNDMDLYVPRPWLVGGVPPMVTFLIEVEGYMQSSPYVPSVYPLYDEIKEIIPLSKGDQRIDVIVCSGPFTIRPILRFHSTLVMNILTGSGIWSAYPLPTTSKKGIANHMASTLDNRPPGLPPANVRSAFAKYSRRGFDIRRNPACWPGDKHDCSISTFCPHALRSSEDDSCMFLRLRPIGATSGLASSISGYSGGVSQDVCEGGQFLQEWHIGGHACHHKHETLEGFVSNRRITGAVP